MENRRTVPWFKMYPRDYLDGTRQMTLEQRGAYMDCLCLIYANDDPIPNDPKWLSHQLHVSVRKAKSLIVMLMEAKKLIETNMGIDNERASFERLQRHDQRVRNKQIAVAREAKKKDEKEVSEHFQPSKTSRKLSETELKKSDKNSEISKKDNENNEPKTKACHDSSRKRATNTESETEKELKKEKVQKEKKILEDIKTAAREWNILASKAGLPEMKKLTTSRANKIKARLREFDGLNDWRKALEIIDHSAFLCGDGGRDGWRANIDFLIRPDNYAKVLEGGYGNGRARTRTTHDVEDKTWRYALKSFKDTGFWSDQLDGGQPGTGNCKAPKSLLDEFELQP